ncbi:MAG TPA: TrkA C-terminal domain-containing protein, partial [bacterium]|nr:TrkA C-terminal domain-containing protein [bacterium]
ILIPELGMLPVIASGVIILLSVLWYIYYAQKRVRRGGAMFQVFQRLGQSASPQLDQELRQILREKGLRKEDTFEENIITSSVLFHQPNEEFSDILRRASGALEQRLQIPARKIYEEINKADQMGETPVGSHIALPHARMEQAYTHQLVIVHSHSGITLEGSDKPVYALFILVSPRDDPGQHLRFLAELANRAEGIDFAGRWREIQDADDIKSHFIRRGDIAEIYIEDSRVVGKKIREIQLHDKCLIALINRANEMIVPHGDTNIERGDKLTLIGEESAIRQMVEYFRNAEKS